MVAIQEISARIGRTTGQGIAGNLCRHYPNWLLQSIVALLFVATTLAAAALFGAAITLSPIDPIKALFGTAVINGVVAVPLMVVMMVMTAETKVMGQFTVQGWLRRFGWASTIAMAACVLGMVATSLI